MKKIKKHSEIYKWKIISNQTHHHFIFLQSKQHNYNYLVKHFHHSIIIHWVSNYINIEWLRCRFVYDSNSTHFGLAECLCMSGVCVGVFEWMFSTNRQTVQMEIEKTSKWMKIMFSYGKFQRNFSYCISFALTLEPTPMPMQGNQPPRHPVIGNQIQMKNI